jgi:hypothetical protein
MKLSILLLTVFAIYGAEACNFSGAFTYRHNSTPAKSRELYQFDGLGLSGIINNCDSPVYVQLDVHQQMLDWAVDRGDWRVDFKIGVQLW